VPLKPIFDKAPLTAMTCQPLRAGMVRSDAAEAKLLYDLAAASELLPADLEGTFRLACLVTAHPEEEPVAEKIRAVLSSQKEDGSFDMPAADMVAVLRAAWAVYEYEARKPLLEPASRWCAWAAKNFDMLMADDAIWAAPADLMELLENLYRVTGKAALLSLCERVSSHSMIWSSVLNTMSSQRPTNRDVTREELENGLRNAKAREDYYPHYYRTNHAETLADGARASMMRGWYSGSATELNAPRNGWERLYRHHGAACGALTADELLEGASPVAAISTASVGAWAEALSTAAMGNQAEWAWDALERLALNAVPACIHQGKLLPFQRVNTLKVDADTKDCLCVRDDHAVRSLRRFVRGYAAIASSAVCTCPDGLYVNLYMNGRYFVPVGEQMLLIAMSGEDGNHSITIHCKQETRAIIRMRLPEWSRNVEITVNGAESDAGRECRAGWMNIDRKWHDGDVITVRMEQTLRVMDGHHQGKYVMQGPMLMAMPAERDCWARSFVRAGIDEQGAYAVLNQVKEWKCSGDVPADVPVLPAASGNEPVRVELVPYASADARITLFPGRKDA